MNKEMEPTFTKEQRLLHKVVLHANDIPARGLFDGQMGIVLVLSEYARARKLRPLKTAINFLLDQVLENLSTEMPLDFANGLTGIGWGVEYLLQNKFQRGQGADICAAIDQKLMQQNILRQTDLSLEKGLEGWLHYIVAHLQGAQRSGRQVFDAKYLQDCAQVCRHILQQDGSSSLHDLCETFMAMVQGQPADYQFDLAHLTDQHPKLNTSELGLRKGLAGQLFTLIQL
jgi:hypothetical protein